MVHVIVIVGASKSCMFHVWNNDHTYGDSILIC